MQLVIRYPALASFTHLGLALRRSKRLAYSPAVNAENTWNVRHMAKGVHSDARGSQSVPRSRRRSSKDELFANEEVSLLYTVLRPAIPKRLLNGPAGPSLSERPERIQPSLSPFQGTYKSVQENRPILPMLPHGPGCSEGTWRLSVLRICHIVGSSLAKQHRDDRPLRRSVE